MSRVIFVIVSMLLSSTSNAQTRTFADWSMGRQTAETGWYAATENDSGNVLGKYCFSDIASCMYLIGMKTSCTSGSKYPVLVNATTGSETLEVYCNGPLGTLGLYQYVFTDFDRINRIVLEAERVGFAVPLRNDRFNVVRFSLVGSNQAIEAMTNAYNRSETPRRGSTRDQRL